MTRVCIACLGAVATLVGPVGSATSSTGSASWPPPTLPGPLQDVIDATSSTTTSSTTSTTTSSTTSTTSTTTTTTPPPVCPSARRHGRTDVGVKESRVTVGALTVDQGPGADYLAGETTALRAVSERVNATGGVCGRSLTLDLRSTGWDPDGGVAAVEALSKTAFALVVNPDALSLDAASRDGLLASAGFPAIGTDGSVAGQFEDPWIWPVGPASSTIGRVIADAQYDSGFRSPSIAYGTWWGMGREVADAYHDHWVARSGAGVPGHGAGAGCTGRSCELPAGKAAYLSEAQVLGSACSEEPACDAHVVAAIPTTAAAWFNAAGGSPGGAEPRDGAIAGPPWLLNEFFARACGAGCDGLRLWTAFRPPVGSFASEPAVSRYVDDLRAVSDDVDVVNQNTQAAYVGAELAVQAMIAASGMPGGLTRDNVRSVLDSTTGWNSGLTVAPLSWSPGDHHAATTLHAFDVVSFQGGFAGFRTVEASTRTDPLRAHDSL
jgi:ABC-type branched-subunit amino acid transport system substrate-binding protein